MSEKKWLIMFLAIVTVGLIGQFLLFRTPAVYQLAFKSQLYDISWWVEKPAEVLVMGGSSAMNDIIPNDITKLNQMPEGSVLNLGMNGATIVETKVAYEKYVQRFGAPRQVYFVISPTFYYDSFLFRKNYEKIYLNFEQWQVLQAEGYPNHYFVPIALFFKSLEWHKDYNFIDYHFDLGTTRRNYGFQPNVSAEFSKEITERFVPRKDEVFGVSKPLLNELEAWVKQCDDQGVELILLLAPYHEVLYKDHKQHPERFQDLFDALTEIFGERVILGSFNPNDFNLSDSHFLNLDHLSSKGAKVYTETIFKDYADHSNQQKRKLENTLR